MTEILNIDDERICAYRGLRYTPKRHIEEKIFIAESEKVAVKLLQSQREVLSVFALREYYEKYEELIV